MRDPLLVSAAMHSAGDVLLRRLERFAGLSPDDAALARDLAQRTRLIPAHADIVRIGDPPGDLRLIVSGWACRYRMLEDGRRQIITLLLPGDLTDIHACAFARMDHSIGALTDIHFAEIPHDRIEQAMLASPAIRRALRLDMLAKAAIQREWTVSLGQRTAFERIGHLFCELYLRLDAAGLAAGTSCEMPITQTDMADLTGITPVHVNRTLQDLRARGLITLKGRVLDIPDFARLQHDVLFSPDYLHLDERVVIGRNGAALEVSCP
ncbi:MAG TPA: Crp/Fnr family transcriptional regulator [Sphingomonas sp.]|nr:Crp/Fnr family transcriptional regulator [Sphingomonas sp.]